MVFVAADDGFQPLHDFGVAFHDGPHLAESARLLDKLKLQGVHFVFVWHRLNALFDALYAQLMPIHAIRPGLELPVDVLELPVDVLAAIGDNRDQKRR